MAGRRERGRCVVRRGAGHGRGEEAVLSDFRSTGSTGRSANGVWHFHRADECHHRQGRAWLAKQPEAKTVTAYVGQGPPRFYLAMSPELPDPSFAKIVVL